MPPAFNEFEALAELFRKLASPVRLAIISELAEGERCVHELVDSLMISQPLVSQHLRILREGRIVRSGRRGREMVYSLADDHVTTILRDGQLHTQEESSVEEQGETEPGSDSRCERDVDVS